MESLTTECGCSGAVMVLLGLIALVVLYEVRERLQNNPPSPTRLPIFGNLLLKLDPLNIGQEMMELSRKLKSPVIYTKVWIPGIICRESVIVNDASLGEQVLSKPDFNYRPDGFSQVYELFLRARGIVLNNRTAKLHKRLFNHAMFIGQSLALTEQFIVERARAVVQDWYSVTESFNPAGRVFQSVMEILLPMLVGKRDSDAEETERLGRELSRIINAMFDALYFEKVNMADVLFAFERVLPFRSKQTRELRQLGDQLDDTSRRLIDLVKSREQDGDMNLVSHLLDSSIGDEDVVCIINDTILGGMHTVSGTLSWFLLLVGLNPRVQDNIFQEIAEHIGDSPPRFEHTAKLPYTYSSIWETLRYRWVGVLYLPHACKQPTVLSGYNIKPGIPIFVNSDCINYNPSIWKNPDEFEPTNFLDRDGKFNKPSMFSPFGNTNRHCSGEQLALREMFIHVVFICRHFKWTLDDSNIKHSLAKNASLSMPPMPFEIKLTPR